MPRLVFSTVEVKNESPTKVRKIWAYTYKERLFQFDKPQDLTEEGNFLKGGPR